MKPTWTDLPSDIRLSIISSLPLHTALSLHSAAPTDVQRQHIRSRIAKLRPLYIAWVQATQPSLRTYSNPPPLNLPSGRAAVTPAQFSRLTVLPVGGTHLKSLRGIGEMRNLHVLDASRNLLNHVPDELENCQQLRVLQLGKNKLNCFPNVVLRMPQLRTLLLHNNNIRTLPGGWTRTRHLHRIGLYQCAIEGQLPDEFCHMLGTVTDARRTRTANLQGNHLQENQVRELLQRFPNMQDAVII